MENKNELLIIKSNKYFLSAYIVRNKWMSLFYFLIGLCSCMNNSKNINENFSENENFSRYGFHAWVRNDKTDSWFAGLLV